MKNGRLERAFVLVLVLVLVPLRALGAAPLDWLDSTGRPNDNAREALRMLAAAPADGLSADDYQAGLLARRAALLDGPAGPSSEAAGAAFEAAMGNAVQRYLRDLHHGRVDPRTVGFRVRFPRPGATDLAARLRSALARQRLPELAAELRPRFAQYGKLREALARYRALDATHRFARLTATVPVKPGNAFADATALHALLVALGDLPAGSDPPAGRYDDALAQGVARFQARHGLAADGVLGRATLAALNVPLARRIEQLELALERLRWVPDVGDGRAIGINIPLFRLWAWDSARPADPPTTMGVVVGKALDTRTPVLFDEMRQVTFRPYWNVPRSILRAELLPHIARDPGYLQRNDLEIVRGGGDDAHPVDASDANIALLRQGALRVRQRPGPKNSMGLVKFLLANDDNVYLHGTPATKLFSQPRRDFSHGCVRLEDPVGLARWVLSDQPRWTRERIEEAMAGSRPLRVDLSRPIPVILFYMTAMVMPADDSLHFASDIYGHDAALARALHDARMARGLPGA
jgi:murein L,D-transpeptidase YcbB/YkuD